MCRFATSRPVVLPCAKSDFLRGGSHSVSESTPKTRQRNRSSKIRIRTLILGVCAMLGIFVFITRYPTAFRMIELRIDDLRMYSYAPQEPRGIIAVVAIDDKSIAAMGRWPWPRDRIAQLVSRLNDYGVKVIGLDLVLSEAEDPNEMGRSDT